MGLLLPQTASATFHRHYGVYVAGTSQSSGGAQGTVVGWFRRSSFMTSSTGNRVWSKESGNILRGKHLAFANSAGAIRFLFSRATSNMIYSSSVEVFTDDKWRYVAVTWNTAAGAGLKSSLFLGNITGSVTHSPWSFTGEGTGSGQPDATSDYWVLFNTAINGGSNGAAVACEWVQMYNRELTLGEIRTLQFEPRPLDSGCVEYVYCTSPPQRMVPYSSSFFLSGTIAYDPSFPGPYQIM